MNNSKLLTLNSAYFMSAPEVERGAMAPLTFQKFFLCIFDIKKLVGHNFQ